MSLLPRLPFPFPSRENTSHPPASSAGQSSTSMPAPGDELLAQPPPVELPLRPTMLTSRYYFLLNHRLWHLLLLSLPLDLLLILLPALPYTEARVLQIYPTVCLGIMFTAVVQWWLRDLMLDLSFALQHVQQRFGQSAVWPAVTLVGLGLAIAVLELISRFAEINITSLVIGAVVLFGAGRSILAAIRQRRAEAEYLARDRTSRIERANYVMFVVSILAPVTIRLASLAGVTLSALSGGLWFESASIVICAAVALGVCYPTLSLYTFACGRCGILTSRALRAGTLCPLCLSEASRDAGLFPLAGQSWVLTMLRKAQQFSESNRTQSDATPGVTSSEAGAQQSDRSRSDSSAGTSHSERVESALRILSAILNRRP